MAVTRAASGTTYGEHCCPFGAAHKPRHKLTPAHDHARPKSTMSLIHRTWNSARAQSSTFPSRLLLLMLLLLIIITVHTGVYLVSAEPGTSKDVTTDGSMPFGRIREFFVGRMAGNGSDYASTNLHPSSTVPCTRTSGVIQNLGNLVPHSPSSS